MRALIVGAGIGGLAAARALDRAGIAVAVFEQVDAPRELGAGLSIWTNAVRALRRLDVPVEAIGVPLDRLELRTRRGHRLGTIPAGAIGRRLGAPSLGVHRAELLAALVEAAGPDRIAPGARCTGFTADPAGVTVHFAGGGSARGDLLIGADGLHSAVREGLIGPTPLRPAGYVAWRGVAPAGAADLPAGFAAEIVGVGQRFGWLPLSGGRTYWFATLLTPPGGSDPPSGAGPALRSLFAGWAAPVDDLIAATPEPDILRHDLYDRRPIRRWSAGRVALLGDAAHPTTPNQGQGACLAIEDAVVLGDCLRPIAGGGDGAAIAAALRAYTDRRHRRATRVVQQSRLFGWIGHRRHPIVAALRELLFIPAIPTLVTREFEALLDWRPERA